MTDGAGTSPEPTFSIDSAANSLLANYGSFDDPDNEASVIDLLVTVTTENDPFADGLLFTNQVRQSQENTFEKETTRDDIIQITLNQPVVANITKGVVASSKTGIFDPAITAPLALNFTTGSPTTIDSGSVVSSTDLAANPINSNVSGEFDAGDLVTFAIVVENTGNSRKGAFDIKISDVLPAGFEIPTGVAGLNLQVIDGTGATINYTGLDGGSGSDLFGSGIELVDPGPTPAIGSGLTENTNAGAIDVYDPDSGTNIAIISYDLQVSDPTAFTRSDTNRNTLENITNTATLISYANYDNAAP